LEAQKVEPPSNWAATQFTEADRFCDLVMKGGVTSGVVYPLAICRLAQNYYFKNIGGTSVGAIAAVLTAAAEYRRRRAGSGEGFVKLAALPGFLQQPGALPALFAADKPSRNYLSVALQFVGTASLRTKIFAGFLKCVTLFGWPYALAVVVVILELALALRHGFPLPASWWLALISSTALVLFAGTVATFLLVITGCLARLSPACHFGWCHGHDEAAFRASRGAAEKTGSWIALSPGQAPPLTDWLHGFIQETAGRTVEDRPLTIGDLRSTSDPPTGYAGVGQPGVDLRMVTTCVTLGRPFTIPFDPDDAIPGLCFRPDEFRKFFPDSVVDALIPKGSETAELVPFPRAEDIPLVVAARLSMSFPVLFCAVPLWAPDARNEMRQIWFSDGGLASNFPIHFFDSPLPSWPTFAIDLVGGNPEKKNTKYWSKRPLTNDDPGAVFMESDVQGGGTAIDPWDRFDGLAAFLMGIIDTMRTWQDSTLRTLLANSSRTVAIRLSDNEGGLNLNMPPQVVKHLTERGYVAGDTLVHRFDSAKSGWKDHGWIRYRTALAELTRWLGLFHGTYSDPQKPRLDYKAIIANTYVGSLSPSSATVLFLNSQNVASQDLDATDGLDKLAADWDPATGKCDFLTGEPIPKASLRTRPPF
jgi:hypothetical protein